MRIAFLDIETAPAIIAAFPPLHETNAVWIESPTYILSFAVSWNDEKKVKAYCLPDYPLFDKDIHDDKSLLVDLHKVLDEATHVVAHNGTRFDVKVINSRLIIQGFKPYSPFKTIDTLTQARKIGKWDSARLDALCQACGVGRKLATTGKDLWRSCRNGDRQAFEKMRHYNSHDVRLLKPIWALLKPWASNVDFRPYQNGGCPICLSNNIQRRGSAVARSLVYQRLHCRDCGKWFSGERINAKENKAA